MNLLLIFFTFFGIVSLAGGIFILFSNNVVHAAFALMASFAGIAAIFILAGADFLGISQIMVYVGGILVLLLFGIMMTRRMVTDGQEYSGFSNLIMGSISGILFFALLTYVIIRIDFPSLSWIETSAGSKESAVRSIGVKLITDFILPFETAALILMAALIGASYIAAQIVKRK
jgi:NADH:ubiquinone oxidoreductase subunit 6 (subunit J)